jgi:hypothetical protein
MDPAAYLIVMTSPQSLLVSASDPGNPRVADLQRALVTMSTFSSYKWSRPATQRHTRLRKHPWMKPHNRPVDSASARMLAPFSYFFISSHPSWSRAAPVIRLPFLRRAIPNTFAPT